MRYQGRVSEWKDDRGFGFISPKGGGAKVFLHIYSFSNRSRRPVIGDLVTYARHTDDSGRPKADSVQFVGDRKPAPHHFPNAVVSVFAAVLVVAFIGYVAYVRISHPNSTVYASVYKIFVAREALLQNSEFQCSSAKSSCSKMTSCAEAFFHQERCGVSEMDGDGDGIPCERQWCN